MDKKQNYVSWIQIALQFIQTNYIEVDIVEDVETRFDTSNCELGRPLPRQSNKKVIGLMKDELGKK